MEKQLNAKQRKSYSQDGYLIVRQLFNTEETALLHHLSMSETIVDKGYKNGFLYPEAMIAVMIALTESVKANGCLQVLRGSHKMQRFEHVFIGEQQGADPIFVEHALKESECVYAELQPGDALFFHPNLLHRSDANNSDKPRWTIISAYNLDYNVPFREKNPSCITLYQIRLFWKVVANCPNIAIFY